MREARGWNKSDLARKCDVDQSYIFTYWGEKRIAILDLKVLRN